MSGLSTMESGASDYAASIASQGVSALGCSRRVAARAGPERRHEEQRARNASIRFESWLEPIEMDRST
jgi:hypothetical protein